MHKLESSAWYQESTQYTPAVSIIITEFIPKNKDALSSRHDDLHGFPFNYQQREQSEWERRVKPLQQNEGITLEMFM